MSAMEVWVPDAVEPAEERLVVLAATINREYAACRDAAVSALEHAMNCGDALNEARKAVPDGQWTAWLAANVSIGSCTAYTYQRLARFRSDIVACGQGLTTPAAAARYLRESGVPFPTTATNGRKVTWDITRARRMRESGATFKEIALVVGVTSATVFYGLDPEAGRRQKDGVNKRERQRADERKALAKAEQAAEVRRHGGTIAHAYADIRKAAQHLQSAVDAATDPATRTALQVAATCLVSAETEIVKAIRIERQS